MADLAQSMGGLMLITEAYREQNAELHQRMSHYGTGGAKWKWAVLNILDLEGLETVLDYGCGKGDLKRSLPNRKVFEYDPAIEGKTVATPADLVVCTDVLEHIEPELIDNVLDHILSVTNKKLLFSISTIPAKKFLADGRNAHLSLQDSHWWLEKLSKNFRVVEWKITDKSVQGKAIPIRELAPIVTISAMAESDRIEHMRVNSKAIKARLQDNIPPHDRTAILVCYGPSLKQTYRTIPAEQGDIFTVSGAHKFLFEKGIFPFAHIDCDPRPHKTEQMGFPVRGVKYWMASCVHPSYIEKLRDQDVALWHLHNGPETQDALFNEIEPDGWLLLGGGSVGLRAVSLLYSQGYRKFSVHGMDCSHADGERFAGQHLGKNAQPVQKVRCGERWFDSNLSLIDYARQFLDDLRLWPSAEFSFHGDGLLQHMIKESQK
jgi:hypothetical protein